jgi:hypothetical protein
MNSPNSKACQGTVVPYEFGFVRIGSMLLPRCKGTRTGLRKRLCNKKNASTFCCEVHLQFPKRLGLLAGKSPFSWALINTALLYVLASKAAPSNPASGPSSVILNLHWRQCGGKTSISNCDRIRSI